MLQHLVHGGLADKQTGLAPTVIVGDLAGHGLKHGSVLRLHLEVLSRTFFGGSGLGFSQILQ